MFDILEYKYASQSIKFDGKLVKYPERKQEKGDGGVLLWLGGCRLQQGEADMALLEEQGLEGSVHLSIKHV